MMACKKVLKYVVMMGVYVLSMNVFAADLIAKEEITPPAENGPLTMEQVPPINIVPAEPAN